MLGMVVSEATSPLSFLLAVRKRQVWRQAALAQAGEGKGCDTLGIWACSVTSMTRSWTADRASVGVSLRAGVCALSQGEGPHSSWLHTPTGAALGAGKV